MFRMFIALVAMMTAGSAAAQSMIERSVLGGGGGISISETILVNFTLGQGVAAQASGGDISLDSGYWHEGGSPGAVPDFQPIRFALHSPWPNPFRQAATIRFDVPNQSGRVELRVIDLAGRHIQSLFSAIPTPGAHSVTWTGRSDSGAQAGSGAYLIVLSAPGFQRHAKVIYVR